MLTVKQAATRLGISASKLYQLVSERAVAHYKVGGKLLFGESDLDAYLESCRVGVAPKRTAAPTRGLPKLKHLKL